MMIEFRTLLKEIKAARAHRRVFSGHFLNETSRWIQMGIKRPSSGNFPLWIALLSHNIVVAWFVSRCVQRLRRVLLHSDALSSDILGYDGTNAQISLTQGRVKRDIKTLC